MVSEGLDGTAKRSEAELEDIVRNDPNVTYFERGESWDFPEIDYSNFAEEARGAVPELIQLIKSDLSAPYIATDFPNHAKRGKWKEQMRLKHGNEFGLFLSSNILRKNNISRLASPEIFGLLMEAYQGGRKDELQELEKTVLEGYSVVNGFESQYDTMSNEKKIAFARSIKQCYYKILILFGRDGE